MRLSIKQARFISQLIFLFLFLCLFIKTESKGTDEIGYPVKLFLEFDPFLSLNVIIANRSFSGISFLFVYTFVITVFLGRVFCGWVCPLGFLSDVVAKIKIPKRNGEKRWFGFKYYLLFFIFVGSAFSIQFAGFFDPLSFLIRSFTVSIYPATVFALETFIDLLYSVKFLNGVTNVLYGFLRMTVLPFKFPHFYQSFFIGALFLFVLGLNLLEKRFWCKYLCPLGALLGLITLFPLIKRYVSEECNGCHRCTVNCAGGLKVKTGKWYVSECIECFECNSVCHIGAIRYGRNQMDGRVDLSKRSLILSIFLGTVSSPLVRVNPFYRERYFNPKLIRPPGSLKESEFLKRCIRCGECMKVCPTGGLQPSLFESGLEGIWTPILVPKVGYCEFKCTMCGQVCPVGAIRRLSQEEKEKTKIGLAFIDKNRCLPYAFGKSCIVCEEVCPTPKKAIRFEEIEITEREGKKLIKQPRVDPELCVGCGICEAKCPVSGTPAIYVTSIQESRAEKNRLFL